MILGLPWGSWLLLLVGVGLGFGISLRFYLAHRGEGGSGTGSEPPISAPSDPQSDTQTSPSVEPH